MSSRNEESTVPGIVQPGTVQLLRLLGGLYLRRSIFRLRSLLLVVLSLANALLASLADTHLNPTAFESHMFEVFYGFILPATALVLGVGVVRDELDTGTLGYLLLRPITRTQIYVTRLVTACGVSILLALANTLAVIRMIPLPESVYVGVLLSTSVVGAIALTVLYAAIGAVFRRPFLVGIGWLLGIERILASVPFDGRLIATSSHLMNLSGLSNTLSGRMAFLQDQISIEGSCLYFAFALSASLVGGVVLFSRRTFHLEPSAE